MTLEEVFLRAPPRVCYRWRGADRLLEREQPFQHADRRVEGRAHRAALRLAVPAAVHELFAQQSIDEPIAARPEVRAERQDATVDARLDLTLEERGIAELRSPGDVAADAIDRGSRAGARRVEPQVAQEQQRVQVRPPAGRGRAVAPMAVGGLLIEQPRAPSLRCDTRPLSRDDLGGAGREVAHGPPTDRRVGIEEPFDDGVVRGWSERVAVRERHSFLPMARVNTAVPEWLGMSTRPRSTKRLRH